MKNHTKKSILIFALGSMVFSACKKDEDPIVKPPINEEELITTMELHFTDSAGIAPSTTAVFSDPDGEGGNNPMRFDTIRLNRNTVYFMEILLLNQSVSPVDTISHEVEDEADEHLFCFEANKADLEIERIDSDGVYELGLKSKWTTGSISTGSVVLRLKHQPGVKNGSCAPGDTDIEVNFLIEIE